MHAALLTFALLASPPVEVDTAFQRVHPPAPEMERQHDRAVVLIHGLRVQLTLARAKKAAFHDWQQPGSTLVTALSTDGDVWSFAYGQDVSVPDVAASSGLASAIATLKDAGYTEIVLVGHSSGGLVARELVESHTDGFGISRIVQVCSPNGGSRLANAGPSLTPHGVQAAFLRSISTDGRVSNGRTIPDAVEAVTVVCDGFGAGDLVVFDERQWPADLQAQGIPAVQVRTMHFTAMRSTRIAPVIARLVREKQPRWTPEQVAAARADFVENPVEKSIAEQRKLDAQRSREDEPPDPEE